MGTPYSIVELAVTDSTQDDARDLFRRRPSGRRPVLVVAGSQRRGRGRGGAGWVDADRGVAMSLAFSPPPPPSGWSTIPLTVGVAMAETVDCSLKWPNDLVRDDAKLGGILVEASGDVVVAGVGLNLFWAEPMEGACALFETDPGPAVGAGIARSWAGTTLALLAGDHWPRERYRARCTTLGRDIAWDGGRGRAADVACDGALEVDVDGERRSLRSGAVRHVRMR